MNRLSMTVLSALVGLTVWGQSHNATMVRDSVLDLDRLVKRTWTTTIKGVEMPPFLLRFIGMAIGDEYFTFSPGWKGGGIYRMADGGFIRPLSGKSFLDQSEGFALEPTSERIDRNGHDLWLRAIHIIGMEKHNSIVRVNMETGDMLDSIPTHTSMYFREPQNAGDTVAYVAQDLASLWGEYNLPFGEDLRSVKPFGHGQYLWLNVNNREFFLYDTKERICWPTKEVVLGGKVYPAANMIGFGPKHLAVGECKEEGILLTLCELRD